MALLNSDSLAQQRRQATESLDQTCHLITPGVMTDDGAGGQIEGDETSVSVACRIAPPNARELEIASRLSQDVDAVVTLPYGTDASALSQIGGPDGDAYQIVQNNTQPSQSYRTATRLFVRRIR